MGFPSNFIWGAATSAYQIEGSPLADGAGPSHWHYFSRKPGAVHNGDTGDVACDHYRRYRQDVALMRDLGLQAYRFSINWARVLPEGRGCSNANGLDFYHRLVDELLAAGIQPFATLYHWDLPAALEERGGWLNRDSAGWFSDYAEFMYRHLGDRVQHWATFNEPWVVMHEGYYLGTHAPGLRNFRAVPQVAHHILLAHAQAVQCYRAEANGQIGLVVNLEPKYPASERSSDQAATRRVHAYMNRFFLDTVFFGRYPAVLTEIWEQAWPEFSAEDMALIQQPLDYLGINYYSRNVVQHDPHAPPFFASRVRQAQNPHTAMDWEVYPEGLTDTLKWVWQRYGNQPLYITENGAAFDDGAVVAGKLDDPARIDYCRQHLQAIAVALEQGIDVRGYFAWSLLDNFEWAFGYSKRFGLVHVDPVTQQRTPKASASFYRDVIASNGGIAFD